VDPRSTLAFRISDWLAHHAGSARVLVAGELEGALNIWADVPQAGGSAQGVSNYLVPAAHRQITLGCGEPQTETRLADLWLRALDVRYLVVHGPDSAEHFHWFVRPERFAAWPAVWTDGAGDTIYKLPPPDEREAAVVDMTQMQHLGELHATNDVRFLEAYVAWARGIREAHLHWLAPDRAELQADVGPNEAVLIKVNHDAGWSSSEGTLDRDPIGFLLVQGASGAPVSLRFGPSWSVWLGRAITIATILLLLCGVPFWATAAVALGPAIFAYAILQAHTPAAVAVAEQAYDRLQPPLISNASIVDGVTFAQPPLKRGSAISVFGSRFGSPSDTVRVWVSQRQAEILYRDSNQVNLRLPMDAPAVADVSVEVNGCLGNSFAVSTRLASP
jgi:hypothetical protein